MTLRALTRSRRAVGAGIASLLAVSTVAVVAASPASADDSSTLTVVGTSDVFDSNLVQSVIKPGFEAAYPNITLNYISKGTGAAIAYAQAGSASALIVHAASVENQFVSGGYSAEQYGRAIFYGDYVLLSQTADAAGVKAADPNDAVGAFEAVATAGAANNATFVSRGGTPGTTIQEHAIWALTTGVPTCAVSAANGGGTTPTTAAAGATTDPRPACPATVALPDWYKSTGLTQGPNVVNGDACNYPNGNCYVFTDRGTFQYLQQTKAIKTLSIVTRDNSATAPGGSTLLVNSFHAYAVNAAKFAGNPSVEINSAGATKFLNWLTSPSAQAAVGNYLSASQDGAPFLPDAAPQITTSALPTAVVGGKSFTITGTVKNVVPGTPALDGVPVTLKFTPTALPDYVGTAATTTTDADGKFSLTYSPVGAAKYTVSTGAITKVEIPKPTLDPEFGDLLAASTTPSLGPVAVSGTPTITKLVKATGATKGTVSLTPADGYQAGELQLYAAKVASPQGALKYVSSLSIPRGTKTLNFSYFLPKAQWRIQLRYVNNGVITAGNSVVKIVTVG